MTKDELYNLAEKCRVEYLETNRSRMSQCMIDIIKDCKTGSDSFDFQKAAIGLIGASTEISTINAVSIVLKTLIESGMIHVES